ncbi:MAG TPA: alpha/beta hydrolase, partial [Egibacteraceae bacterium]|nr:alpha/beta hydrolase [Egibacteraceae bacterium]
ARMLANRARAVVVSVGYRLAPEHPYPAALEDALAAVTWAADEADALGADGGRLAVAGDSSGGNLAAAACLWARDHGGPTIAAQCLVYPVTDLEPDDGSWREFGQGANLDAGDMEWFNANYAADPRRRAEPYASPLRAPDLSGLPPAIVATASHDILRDQGEAYARRLEGAGVAVFARRYEGLVHGFFRFSEVSPAARRANEEICARLRALLHGGGAPG